MSRWGMYRVMSASLLVLLVVSLVFAATGIIGYQPQGILATAVIAVGTTLVATIMFSQTFKAIAHLESSLITGLLITFIVPPTLQLADLGGAAAAGALAGASKFLLVHRKRHFLNPAALGVTITGLLGLTASFWWVAAPPLTTVIVLLGLLVAWRGGVLAVALTGLLVGVGVTLVRLLVSGQELLTSVYLVTTSYPIVFLALFMLTEPLTLPGRFRARILVAVVVGIGLGLPFAWPLGSYTLYSSPELALIVGNVVALIATLATRATRSAEVTLIESEQRGSDRVVFRFSLNSPLHFLAGQWIELHFPHRAGDQRGERRVFSVASPPHQAQGKTPTFEVWTRVSTPGSSFKHALNHAPVSSSARISDVGGDFVLPQDRSTPLLLIAGGVGITPFASQLAELAHQGVTREVVLIEVRSHPDDAWCDEVIREAGATHVVTSREGLAQALSESVPDIADRWCAVSGSPGFVKYATRLATKAGAPKVATDSFIGY